ncbi:unnamed protein product [Heligmosomoides polygyrus]|uniref:Lipoprotein n=1 Tax=Heligmosomoides polygyrus TaxID=6339 RepID=A0A183GKZ0_HELPZ|nr:unnamed protein product [Heligmosomoides polygyrus]
MRLHAVDTSGGNVKLQDDSMVEKFNISEEQYNQREGECQQHGFNRVDSTFPLGQDPERFVLGEANQ